MLAFPVACTLGETCFIQNFVDRDPGPGAADFTCGPLSYDGHKGTDIALHDLVAMESGVAVRAVAPGTVRGVRDGMDDTPGQPATPDPDGRDCGNGVVIDHGGGWESQYCHLRKGSVASGQRVTARTVLGEIGHSGRTEFPHLHLSLRENGRVVDPFHPDDTLACGVPPDRQLWRDRLEYAPGGVIALGFSDSSLDYAAVKAGTAGIDILTPEAPVLMVWAHMFGVRDGDNVHFAVTGPDGATVLTASRPITRTQARRAEAAGIGRGDGPWPAGRYSASVRLVRGEREIGRAANTLSVPAPN